MKANISLAATFAITGLLMAAGDSSGGGLQDDTQGDMSNFHPGHYLFYSADANVQQTTLHELLAANPMLRGIHVGYEWHLLEGPENSYNMRRILNDLEWAHDRGKHLIVMIRAKSLGAKGKTYFPFPEYIVNDKTLWTETSDGYVVLWWNDKIATRLKLLIDAISSAIADSPHRSAFEGFYLAESAVRFMDTPEPEDMPRDNDKWAENMTAVLSHAQARFTSIFGEAKLVGQFTNGKKQLREFGPRFQAAGHGFGRPNVRLETAQAGATQDLIKSYVYPGVARGTPPPDSGIAEVPLVMSPQGETYKQEPSETLNEIRLIGAHYVSWQVYNRSALDQHLKMIAQHPKSAFIMITRPKALATRGTAPDEK